MQILFFSWECDQYGRQEQETDKRWKIDKDEHGDIVCVLCPDCKETQKL